MTANYIKEIIILGGKLCLGGKLPLGRQVTLVQKLDVGKDGMWAQLSTIFMIRLSEFYSWAQQL